MRKGILNYTQSQLEQMFLENGIERFRAKQVLQWIYRFGKKDFQEMTNLNSALKNKLSEMFYIYRPKVAHTQKSSDGTIKFLLEMEDKSKIETVFIPEQKRSTLCVSSQVGCAVGCKFCNTGYNGFVRNLASEEIISQFLVVKDFLNLWEGDSKRLSNIVFMGMGEPLFNWENVNIAIKNLMLDEKEGLSRRKITVSTSGIAPVLQKIVKDLPCRLAISLHAPNDLIRGEIMPINNLYKIESIMSACKEYCQHHEYLKITFEYLLLKNINDSDDCAIELVRLLKGINSKVNLLQFNSWKGCRFEPSERVHRFAKMLEKNGIEAPIRERRGEDIMAACGQLSAKEIC